MTKNINDVVYEKTMFGQAIYNVYRKHGSKLDFFKQSKKWEKNGEFNREVVREWERLERIEKKRKSK